MKQRQTTLNNILTVSFSFKERSVEVIAQSPSEVQGHLISVPVLWALVFFLRDVLRPFGKAKGVQTSKNFGSIFVYYVLVRYFSRSHWKYLIGLAFI
jgi:hypothetical protein